MKYIKEFYNNTYDIDTDPPEIGDYIVSNIKMDNNSEWSEYINGVIGQLVRIRGNVYLVKCEISVDAFNKYFKDKEEESVKIEKGKYYIIMNYPLNNINFWSKDKEELELLLVSKKYNL